MENSDESTSSRKPHNPSQSQGLPDWRTGYDDREKGRVAAGVTNGRVFRGAEDPNDVVILVADMGRARAWFTGEDLKAAMQKGGVVGPTSYHFSF